MPAETDTNQVLKPKDLLFTLAIAGSIDAQSRALAKELDADRGVYYAYATLDSLSSSYSMFKYYFDVFVSYNDPDAMHELMMTPSGMMAIATESIFLVAFSLLACKYDEEKENALKRFIAASWPYFRDMIKGLKNAYKGWRSAVLAVSLIGGIELQYMIVPIGLILGVFAAANRIWLRNMVENRKLMMSENDALLLEIKNQFLLSKGDLDSYLNRIKYQSSKSRTFAFLAVSLGGFIDGLYLYAGVLSLAVLSPSTFIVMAVMCAIYTVACMISRIYEEYDFQLKLIITQSKCKLSLISKEVEISYNHLALQTMSSDSEQLKQLKSDFCILIDKFEEARAVLQQQITRTYLTAGLLGLKNGLYAYSALTSMLFLIAVIFVLAATPLPAILLIANVSLGMVGMIGFFFHSLRMNYLHLNQQKALNERLYYRLIEMKNKLENNYDTDNNLDSNCFRESLKDGLVLDPAPQFFYQEWFEVIRSLFSGLGKGQKFVDFAGNPLQEVDEQGHCHDTPVMFVLASISAIFFGVILGLRAFARGLGRTPLGEVDLNADIELATIISKTNPETKAVSESMMVHPTEEGCKITKVLEMSEDLQVEIQGKPNLTSNPQNRSHLYFLGSFFKQQPLPVLSCRGEHNLLIPDVSLTSIV